MKVELRFFAALRETLGTGAESVDVPDDVHTVGALRQWLCARGGDWGTMLAEGRAVRMALDQQMAGPDARLREGAEVAFFPPVTGG